MIRANDESRDQVGEILDRFHHFDDAVVRSVNLTVSSTGERVVVSLEARESASDQPDWLKVQLTIDGVAEYRLTRNDRDYHYVLSLGLKIGHFGSLYYFDFGPSTDEPDCLEDFQASPFYVAGRDVSWKVLPYPKAWETKNRSNASLGTDR